MGRQVMGLYHFVYSLIIVANNFFIHFGVAVYPPQSCKLPPQIQYCKEFTVCLCTSWVESCLCSNHRVQWDRCCEGQDLHRQKKVVVCEVTWSLAVTTWKHCWNKDYDKETQWPNTSTLSTEEMKEWTNSTCMPTNSITPSIGSQEHGTQPWALEDDTRSNTVPKNTPSN